MALDYFYGSQADEFSFYRIPKVLFTDSRYKSVSMEAKVLYGLMLDRMGLSVKNKWMDDAGRVFIIYSIEEIMEALGCGNKKVSLYLNELERDCGLIERKRQGLGRPNIIYVKNFISDDVQGDTSRRVHADTSRNVHVDTSRNVEPTRQEVSNGHANNTEINKTNMSDTERSNLFTSFRDGEETKRRGAGKQRVVSEEERAGYKEQLEDNIDTEFLNANYPEDEVEEILDLLLDTVSTGKDTVLICGEEKPAETVRSRFLKLDHEHIAYVLDRLKENTTEIRNPKQYILAALWNAPMTIGNHYAAMVAHDMNRRC